MLLKLDRLMSFVRGVSASPIFVRYIDRLREYHIASGHFAEAALTLKVMPPEPLAGELAEEVPQLHADLYKWDQTAYLDAIPESNLPRESEFARKEVLYSQIIELLTQGRAWETALALCKELQGQYETQLYAYQRLSENLARQALLYAKIVQEPRVYPMVRLMSNVTSPSDLFASISESATMVAAFPSASRTSRCVRYEDHQSGRFNDAQFVYRGNELERLVAYVRSSSGLTFWFNMWQLLRTDAEQASEGDAAQDQHLSG